MRRTPNGCLTHGVTTVDLERLAGLAGSGDHNFTATTKAATRRFTRATRPTRSSSGRRPLRVVRPTTVRRLGAGRRRGRRGNGDLSRQAMTASVVTATRSYRTHTTATKTTTIAARTYTFVIFTSSLHHILSFI